MPNLNRRSFLQVLGAVGFSPYLPSLPVGAAAAKGGAATSKALWASLYANSGSATEFVGVARNMGLSNAAIQGVGACSIGVRLTLAATTQKLTHAATKAIKSATTPELGVSKIRHQIERAIQNIAEPEPAEILTTEPPEAETLLEEKIKREGD